MMSRTAEHCDYFGLGPRIHIAPCMGAWNLRSSLGNSLPLSTLASTELYLV